MIVNAEAINRTSDPCPGALYVVIEGFTAVVTAFMILSDVRHQESAPLGAICGR